MNYFEFETKQTKYIYDNSTGYVIPVDDVISKIIKNYCDDESSTYSAITRNGTVSLLFDEFKTKYDYVSQCVRHGMFFTDPISSAPPPNTLPEVKEFCYSINTASLILVVTENCNMRCKYCVYNKHYPQELSYSNENMDLETAKKSIDMFAELCHERERRGFTGVPNIGFYGGEPLLRESLIRKVVNYSKQKMKDVAFSLTTNGTILTEDIIHFLVDNHFIITFSIDGDKKNHDRNRVLIDESPTHDIVAKNIKQFQKYKKTMNDNTMLSFSCCYDKYTDLEEFISFFADNYEDYFPFRIQLSPVIAYDTTFHNYNDDVYKGMLEKQNQKESLNRLFQVYVDEQYGKMSKDLFGRIFSSEYAFLIRNRETQQGCLNNSCIPTTKLAVYPDGTITLCEKMNKKLPIGNIACGLDWVAVNKLISNFYQFICTCRDCPISRLCYLCFQTAEHNNKGFSAKEGFCKNELEFRKDLLIRVYTAFESGKNLLDLF